MEDKEHHSPVFAPPRFHAPLPSTRTFRARSFLSPSSSPVPVDASRPDHPPNTPHPEPHAHADAQVRAGTVVRLSVLIAALTVTITTSVSFARGDVPSRAFVPMISDTFVIAPASYVSRVGMSLVGSLSIVNVLSARSYLLQFAVGDGEPHGRETAWVRVTDAHSAVGAFGSFALLVVAAVNEKENLDAHFSAASFFLIATWLWHCCLTAQLCAHSGATSKESATRKTRLLAVSGVSLTLFFTLTFLDSVRFYETIAVCEWVAGFASGTFTWSLGVELDGEAVDESADFRLARSTTGSGMALGTVWRGRCGGDGSDELVDVSATTRREGVRVKETFGTRSSSRLAV